MRKTLLIAILTLVTFLLIAGCEQLRFQPTEAQKQIAFQSHMTARDIEDKGTSPHSPAASQQVQGSQAALAYIGLPRNPVIEDYETTVAKAANDAAQRPTVVDVMDEVDEGLSLLSQILIAIGLGGTGFGGKKIIELIKEAREKNKALSEVIVANQGFLDKLKGTDESNIIELFKKYQDKKQSASTKRIVTEVKS